MKLKKPVYTEIEVTPESLIGMSYVDAQVLLEDTKAIIMATMHNGRGLGSPLDGFKANRFQVVVENDIITQAKIG